VKTIIPIILLCLFLNGCSKEDEYAITPNATFEIVMIGNGKIELHSHNANAIVQVDWGDIIETVNYRTKTKIEHEYKSNSDYTIVVNKQVCGGDDAVCEWIQFWTKDIKITDRLIANFEYRITDNGILKYLFTGSSATKYSWDFGDNTPLISGEAPQHEYSKNGQYKVKLTASNDKYSDSITKTITIIK
jgi:PKD repeat protein